MFGEKRGGDRLFSYEMAREEIALLEEEMIQLSVKSSRLVPLTPLSLVCSVWMKKNL